MVGSVHVCAESSGDIAEGRGTFRQSATRHGPTATLRSSGCSRYTRPSARKLLSSSFLSSPLVGKTIDWRAVCGKSASTVRRAGPPGNRLSRPLSGALARLALRRSESLQEHCHGCQVIAMQKGPLV